MNRKPSESVVVVPAPALPPVDYDAILMGILATMRRAQAILDAEAELAGMRIEEKRERLARLLSPFAVP